MHMPDTHNAVHYAAIHKRAPPTTFTAALERAAPCRPAALQHAAHNPQQHGVGAALLALQHASLRHASLRHASLRHASLRHASLQHAALQHAALQHVSLRHALLRHASLQHASLQHQHASLQHTVGEGRIDSLLSPASHRRRPAATLLKGPRCIGQHHIP